VVALRFNLLHVVNIRFEILTVLQTNISVFGNVLLCDLQHELNMSEVYIASVFKEELSRGASNYIIAPIPISRPRTPI
jgi:hypothetical protein